MTENEYLRQIARLKRENEYYRRRLAYFSGAEKKNKTASRAFMRRITASGEKSYLGYLKNRISASEIISLYSRIFFALRKYLLASAVFKVLIFILGLVHSSAVLLIVFSAFAVLLPAFAIISIASALLALLSRRSVTKKLTGNLCGRVYIVFGTVKGKYRAELISGGTLLCVTSSLSACGFSSAKRLRDGGYNIHISYIFSLSKKLGAMKNIEIIKIF